MCSASASNWPKTATLGSRCLRTTAFGYLCVQPLLADVKVPMPDVTVQASNVGSLCVQSFARRLR